MKLVALNPSTIYPVAETKKKVGFFLSWLIISDNVLLDFFPTVCKATEANITDIFVFEKKNFI